MTGYCPTARNLQPPVLQMTADRGATPHHSPQTPVARAHCATHHLLAPGGPASNRR